MPQTTDITKLTIPELQQLIQSDQAEMGLDQSQIAAANARITYLKSLPPPAAKPTITIVTPVAPAGHVLWARIAYPDDWKQHGANGAVVELHDSAGVVRDTLPLGTVAGFEVDQPGTWSIVVREAGGVTSATAQVPEAGRIACAWTPAAQSAPKSGMAISAAAGNFNVLQVSNLTNVLFQGAGVDKTFLIDNGPASVENLWTSSANITLRDFTATSPVVNGQPTGTLGTTRGSRLSLINVKLGDLISGIRNDSAISFLYLSGITTQSGTSIQSQVIYLGAVDGFVLRNSDLNGSVRESPFRTTAPTGAVNAVIDNVKIEEPVAGKADSTDRAGSHQRWNKIICTNGEFSIKTGGAETGTLPTQTTDVLLTDLTTVNGLVRIGDGASDIWIKGGVFANETGETLNISQTGKVPWPVTKIVIEGVDFRPGTSTGSVHPPYKIEGVGFKPGDIVIRKCTCWGKPISDYSS